uniref:Uncharacterized protein n=1 Tax=Opuntia streptacantha TaxID=393608 RepID=A0A7C9ANT7_OPUST
MTQSSITIDKAFSAGCTPTAGAFSIAVCPPARSPILDPTSEAIPIFLLIDFSIFLLTACISLSEIPITESFGFTSFPFLTEYTLVPEPASFLISLCRSISPFLLLEGTLPGCSGTDTPSA